MSDWDLGLEDEEAGAVMRTVSRQLKLWREAAKNPDGPRLSLTPTVWSTFLPYASDH